MAEERDREKRSRERYRPACAAAAVLVFLNALYLYLPTAVRKIIRALSALELKITFENTKNLPPPPV